MYGIMRQRLTYYSIAAFFSIILSVWASLKTSVINPDAICYLYSAEALERGLTIASHLCEQAKWPFYSILIFGLAKLTHLSFTTAAYFLNGFFSLISVLAFMAIVNSLTGRIRVVAIAAGIILLAHAFNGLRVDIIRDHGFWAFYLLSLLFVLQYFVHPPKRENDNNELVRKINCGNYFGHVSEWCYALNWSISIFIATLFRIEGAVFLLLLPFAVFADSSRTICMRIKAFIQLNTLTIFGILVLLIWLVWHPQQQLGRLSEIQFQLTHGINTFILSFQHVTHALATYVLSVYSARDASWIAILMFVSWYIFSVISSVSPIYAVLIVFAWWKKIAELTRASRLVLWTYVLINILITGIFLVDHMFLSERYLIALSLVLMVWVPFALDYLIASSHKWLLGLVLLLIVIYGMGGIFDFGHSKKYIRQGGDWLASHATSQQKIYSNDYQLLYYSHHFGNNIFSEGKAFQNLNVIANGKWQQYDFIALRVGKNELEKNTSVLQEIKLLPVAVFQNDRGDQVRIYEIHQKN